MITETQIDTVLDDLFGNITFTENPEGLYDPLRYMISVGGKRLRPKLCLISYALFKDNFDDTILQPAAGLEIFHGFTLIHDDIMDKSGLRRGKPTVWRKWNEDTAILSGDVMCIESYRRIARAPKAVLDKVLDLFTATAAQVCDGQQYDMDFESMDRIGMSDYMKMIGLKTAVLIACAAKIGAVIGGASDSDSRHLYDYGYSLGLAFQIADDYLDTFGDSAVFGKPIGGDIVNNKKSWLLTRAFEKADQTNEVSGKLADVTKKALAKAMEMPVDTEEQRISKIAEVKGLYMELGIDEDAKYEILKLNDKALESAGKVNVGKVRVAELNRFAGKLIGRAR
ncbi:MAG: polyprenyl synthetase family protein [Bacteroidales bacterium]|jgi:geranylgeranyl diphosphate synthase type II|nr:polyprenyl synthetase family protein [Bacteroidales bacterium]MCI1784644.1 polyprenyl synthetase family protein [Bacteroidales bacterium]